MPKRRRIRSSLYQVDFLAALFGAFLLLWVSKPTGSKNEPETAVVVMESSCKGMGLLPKEAKRCVDSDILQLTDPALKLEACAYKSAAPFRMPLEELLREAVTREAVALAPFVFSATASSRSYFIHFSGLAVANIPGRPWKAIGYGSSVPPAKVQGAHLSEALLDICSQGSCTLRYGPFPLDYRPECIMNLYSRAWPHTCLTATFQTGDPAASFDLKPCDQ